MLDYIGLRCSELTAEQKAQLLGLIGVYVGTMSGGHAKVKMADVKKHLDATCFGWMGGTEKDSVFTTESRTPWR